MNKSAIKNFAIWARNKLITDISYRAGLMGITTEGIAEALPQSMGGTEFYDIGTENPYSISGDAIKQRKKLVEVIREKEADTDYATAYKYIMEEVAYTWFNRLIAIRFMEVNEYLPTHIRVLSSDSGKLEPDIVTNPFDTELQFTEEEKEKIVQLKTDNRLDELFCMLFIKQCNALNENLPALFEKTNDYTELLLNISVIDREGVVYKLVHDIPEDDFNIEKGGQVEIIGWLYQYYNTEPKAQVFARPSGTKIRKEDVPAATQLFTPDWIVRYMVENSLGRLWVEGHPNDELKANWKYYLEEAKQEPEVEEKLTEIRREYAKLNPEDIKLIDPCMGSGHILVYAFDVLMQIYESAGYGQRDAARSILENNIYGLDIDDRAFQLAYFAVMMKARQYNRRILNGEHKPNLFSIKESNGINRNHLKYFGMNLSEDDTEKAVSQINALLDTFIDAKEYGSILTVEEYEWGLLESFVADSEPTGQISMETVGIEATKENLLQIIEQGKVLEEKYHVVVTNPPYMAISNSNNKLNGYVNRKYIGGKTDMFSVFIERCLQFTIRNYYTSMITMQSWLFLTSFEKIRNKILDNEIASLAHLGARSFDEISGEIVQTVVFTIKKISLEGRYKGLYSRLVSGNSEKEKECLFLYQNNLYISKGENFRKIPQRLIAYWVRENTIKCFDYPALDEIFITREGMATADNERFLRLWSEVRFDSITLDCATSKQAAEKDVKWIPYNKGGKERDWYGNNEYIVDWSHDGYTIKNNIDIETGRVRSHNYNGEFGFKEGITRSAISSGDLSVRYCPEGFLFDSKGAKGFVKKSNEDLIWILGLLNSKVSMQFLQFISPTLDFKVGDIVSLPFISDKERQSDILVLVKELVSYSKTDWDSYETSWDFAFHPLVKNDICNVAITADPRTISDSYHSWVSECEQRFLGLKANEEELNRIFIDIYGLQDELTPEVSDKDVTVHRVYDSKEDVPESMKGSAYIRTKRDEIVSLLSYAIGCMFGRYSLDSEGLAYAGGEWDETKYITFMPDTDNIIPLTDEEYLEDDIITRLCTWLKVVYGEDTLEENLDFIAKALGNKGNTSREIIRNYFLNDFFKDHCQTYSVTGSGKRPIYWLFESGKQNGFKALIYLHRYNADTVGNLRIDYLHRMQRIYESEIGRMQDTIDHSSNAREVAAATKRREKLQKQLKECREYDEKIAHLALSRIELDLDDGVKVNYRKLQTAADGKFYEVLADSKNIMSKK